MSIDVEYAIKKDIRNNPVVREVDAQQKREFLRATCLAILIVTMGLFAAWQHFRIVQTGYEVQKLQQQRAAEEALNRKLRLEVETLRRGPYGIFLRTGATDANRRASRHSTCLTSSARFRSAAFA